MHTHTHETRTHLHTRAVRRHAMHARLLSTSSPARVAPTLRHSATRARAWHLAACAALLGEWNA